MRKITTGWIALAALIAAAAGATSGHAEPLTIRMGYVQLPGHLAPILFQNKAVLKHYGKSYTVDAIRFRGTTPQIQALSAGELDLATLAPSGLAFAVQNANIDARVVADTFHDNGKTHWTSPFLVLKDSGINTIEDLKGKRLASNAIGSASDAAMRAMLKKHGLGDNDFNTIETAFGNMPAMLLQRKVDMIVCLPQFIKKLDMSKVKTLFTIRDAVGPQQTIMWVMRADFIAKNRAALVDYWEDHIRALRWFLDPKNHDEALKYVMDYTKQPRDAVDYAFTENDYYRSPDARPDVEGIKRGIQQNIESGILKAGIDVDKYVDLSLIEEAKTRIDGKASALQ
ncbi:MAG: ABC transporter substrate-binding protein [Variibacter sp.]|nr:ABC transporter substrate-binding protein [Variibacter sp.]